MSKEKLTIWGREFQLPAYLECYPGEEVLASQQKALEWLLNHSAEIDQAKTKVEGYLMKDHPDAFAAGAVDNIFKYVMPKSIYVPHDPKHSIIAIMCNYKFDDEHGLAVVFDDGQFKAVGSEDIVL